MTELDQGSGQKLRDPITERPEESPRVQVSCGLGKIKEKKVTAGERRKQQPKNIFGEKKSKSCSEPSPFDMRAPKTERS
jgi:hypothetical protein